MASVELFTTTLKRRFGVYSSKTNECLSSSSNMTTFSFSSYDCIGFDLDNTLIRYKLPEILEMEFNILSKLLVEKKNYSKDLTKPLTKAEIDFTQRGLLMDFERGNIVKLAADGSVDVAAHGSRKMTDQQVLSVYPNRRCDLFDSYSSDLLAFWNGSNSMRCRSVLDFFELPTPIIFARIVDIFDEKVGCDSSNSYNIWPDLLESLETMFNQVDVLELSYFRQFYQDPAKYIFKADPKTIDFLKECKSKRLTFLVTGATEEAANSVAGFGLGENWQSLFDVIVYKAKKPGFFTDKRPFLKDLISCESVVTLEQGGQYNQGNWNDLHNFLSQLSHKQEAKCIYLGDNILQDIYAPAKSTNCETLAVTEELLVEGFPKQETSNEKYLSSSFWGSFFKSSTNNDESYWARIIRECAIMCVPTIDYITQPIDTTFKRFTRETINKLTGTIHRAH